ncbi:hypothetical protein QVD17_09377 [Tagetes erecta]|uniref:Uncharacterized protein n=1 Tax=Tagetes erecta TaxID=13708 RepID=A0AAD8NYF2_TARER|nr:hypothetical protein QVD17_09377 [Tagetes erecta]
MASELFRFRGHSDALINPHIHTCKKNNTQSQTHTFIHFCSKCPSNKPPFLSTVTRPSHRRSPEPYFQVSEV